MLVVQLWKASCESIEGAKGKGRRVEIDRGVIRDQLMGTSKTLSEQSWVNENCECLVSIEVDFFPRIMNRWGLRQNQRFEDQSRSLLSSKHFLYTSLHAKFHFFKTISFTPLQFHFSKRQLFNHFTRVQARQHVLKLLTRLSNTVNSQ